MSENNNFIPDQQPYKNLTPFKLFIKTNFPFIEDTMEALDNYGLYCKLVEKMNEIISNENVVTENTQALYNAFVSLNNYVSNYFDNLDVQEEINVKLDELVSDGTIANILNNELLSGINNRVLQNSVDIGAINEDLENAVKTTDTNVISMSMLNQEVRTALTGGSTAVVGTNSVGSENIKNKAIDVYKLDDLLSLNFTKEFENIDIMEYKTEGNYKNVDTSTNTITNNVSSGYVYYDIPLTKGCCYDLTCFNIFAIRGYIIYKSTDNSIIDYPAITDTSVRFEQVKKSFKVTEDNIKIYINSFKNISVAAPAVSVYGINLTKLVKTTQNENPNSIEKYKELEGYSPAINASSVAGLSNTVNLVSNQYSTTKFYRISKGTKYKITASNIYSYPGIVILNENFVVSYMSSDSDVGPTPVAANYEFTASDNGYVLLLKFEWNTVNINSEIYIDSNSKKFTGYKWGILGDSLSDPNVNTTIEKYYDYIKDETGISIQNLAKSGCGYKRKYNSGDNFTEQSEDLDSNCDVVTIFGSFNDGNEFANLGTVNDTTTDTVLGCVYVTLTNIITNCQNAKIGVILPTPWHSVYPANINTNYKKYIDGIKTIANNLSIPVLDLFYESNMFPWVENFKNTFYVNNDGTHPNSAGNKRFYNKILEFLNTLI